MWEEKNKTYNEKNQTSNISQEVLRDVCRNFEGAEEFIKERIEEIRTWEKISVKKVICISCLWKLVFLVLWYVVSLPLALKIAVCFKIKKSEKLSILIQLA